MRIDDYSFGRIVIGGGEYRSDVIVFHDRVRPDWRRLEGHALHERDLEEILAARPSTLVVGRGAMGMMRVPSAVAALLEGRGVRLIARRTAAAVREYNDRAGDPSVVGAFHLTC
ncbi:MAG: MTH938/NDUFAF3 family protein [bacterium]|nr:MTH938/NDUFAF3 family protein [bacterium]